jgi:oligopeptide/dipeptide ABC transporter ATP-binding protein
MNPLLRVEDLKTCIETPRGIARPVDGVSFEVFAGKTHAIVGESGCGKSMTALSIMQLLPEPGGYVESGRILLEDKDLLDLTWTQMSAHRGKSIAMVFQEPMTSLNPTLTIGKQVLEAALAHGVSRREATTSARSVFERVGLNPDLARRQYPHELSGGMRQRVMIAMALINRPKLLIADEPTTALDVTVQAQILRLIHSLQNEYGMALLIITHDLAVVAEIADTVSVMYAGQIVEDAGVQELFANPLHPYTRDLLGSLPSRSKRGQDLASVSGAVPDPATFPLGCRYADRCQFSMPICRNASPMSFAVGNALVRCHLFDPDLAEKEELKSATR